MAVDSSCVGAPWPPLTVGCDTRWLLSYPAGIGVADPRYHDTTRPGGIVPHPVFPVAPEWALITRSRMPSTMAPAEVARGVHAAHDLRIHRPVRPDEEVTLRPVVSGVVSSRAGARTTVDVEAVDREGAPMWTTRMTNVHLGVEVTGGDVPPPPLPELPAPPAAGEGAPTRTVTVEVPATAALVYTECARIWNPIHTDVAAARAAGLPDPVLHGTATLAMAVQAVLDATGADPLDVTALGGEFRAGVPLPSVLTITLTIPAVPPSGAAVTARVVGVQVDVSAAGVAATALRNGRVVLRR